MLWTILCMSFMVSQFGLVTCNNDNDTRTSTVYVNERCPERLHRVDYVDEFWVRGLIQYSNSSTAWWKHHRRCRVTFATTQDQGLCINMKSAEINAEGASLEFLTDVYRPHKHYEKDVSASRPWCAPKNQITMVVRLPKAETYLPPSAFDFSFEVTNKSLDLIEKVYSMASPADCNMHYILKADEVATIHSHVTTHRRNDPIPTKCSMTFTSLSEEEYGQVCVSVEKLDSLPQCDMEIEITGMDTDYWDEKTEKITCKTQKNSTREVCSGDKVLTLKLTRGKNKNSASFQLKVASKWMSYWESAEKIKTDLSFLTAAKSLTVLIATLDTIVVLTAAFISIASRYPYGRLQIIGEIFGKDPTAPHHYANEYPVAVAVTSGESDPPPF